MCFTLCHIQVYAMMHMYDCPKWLHEYHLVLKISASFLYKMQKILANVLYTIFLIWVRVLCDKQLKMLWILSSVLYDMLVLSVCILYDRLWITVSVFYNTLGMFGIFYNMQQVSCVPCFICTILYFSNCFLCYTVYSKNLSYSKMCYEY